MTREEILAMEPGRELDALVAEKVMGWHIRMGEYSGKEQWYDEDGAYVYGKGVFTPSSLISQAWEVVEKLQESQLYADIRTCADFYEVWITIHENGNQTETFACPNLPEAITKAALLAVMDA